MKLKLFLATLLSGLLVALTVLLYQAEQVSAWEMSMILIPVGVLAVWFYVMLYHDVTDPDC